MDVMKGQSWLNRTWPVLNSYPQENLARIAMPLGGIGTGTVALGGRGDLRDWEIMNRPDKGHNGRSLFVLWAKPEKKQPFMRALEGVIQPPYEGAFGVSEPYHGVPRFRECSFHAAYPLAQVVLGDPGSPLDVRLEAFNPLIPCDGEGSGWPLAVLRYVLKNKTNQWIDATVCGSITNFVGYDGKSIPAGNINEFRSSTGMRGLLMRASDAANTLDESWGSIAIATDAEDFSYQCHWPETRWNTSLLHFWDDLAEDGRLDGVSTDRPSSVGSLAASCRIPPNEERQITFLLAWHFPNRQTWTPEKPCCEDNGCQGEACGEAGVEQASRNRIGNYYTRRFKDAWDVIQQVEEQLPLLEQRTVEFVSAFCKSDLPQVVKEAALNNLSTLRSQTCFRTEDGYFFGFEGCSDKQGCCHGSCTHVWNYEQATAHLFGELSCLMREVEFKHATDETGLMSFRVHLPIQWAQEFGRAAADGQMGCIMKLYRDWQLSGDDEMLERLWPKAKKALEFCWVDGGWDADRDGVMEGCQHNTLDVEYYGPNPLMQGWYLGALKAAAAMAEYLGEREFAAECQRLFELGSQWTDGHLFNGQYYQQEIRPLPVDAALARGLEVGMGAEDREDPDYQMGSGCLVDQLAGQLMAHVCGLGYLLDEEHVRQTLESIMTYNFREDLYDHFNHMRTFALNDESGLLMCTFPLGNRPKTPVPYFNELMTGFEYTAAVHMLYEGMIDQGLRCIKAIRSRYDGRKRNPFDEAECGHHYARAMVSWAAVLALTGFRYSGVSRTMEFALREGTFFWSTGYSWGVLSQEATEHGMLVRLKVMGGDLRLRRLFLTGEGEKKVIDLGEEMLIKEEEILERVV